LFAGITGSAVADTSAVGSIIIPAMKEDGYKADFSVGVTACSSVIGVIIPPSIPFVLYGVITGVSIGKLFLGGMIPGILIGLSQMVISYFIAKKYNYGTVSRFSLKSLLKSFSTSFLSSYASYYFRGDYSWYCDSHLGMLLLLLSMRLLLGSLSIRN